MDDVDITQARMDLEMNRGLAAYRRRRAPFSPAPGCLGCGVRISPARRRAVPGCGLCIDCQRELEERAR